MKKLLMITNRILPPIYTGRGIRNRRIAEYSSELGWEVIFLLPELFRSQGKVTIGNSKNKYFTVPPLPLLEKVVMKYFFKIKSFKEAGSHPEKFGGLLGRLIRIINTIIFPDDFFYSRTILPISVNALKILRIEKIDAVYTTCYPFSFHFAGLLIKYLFGIPWIAVFEDPWVGNPAHFKKKTGLLHKFFEKKVVENADKVLIYGNYAEPKHFFRTYSYLPREKFHIFNFVLGYDSEKFEEIKPKKFEKFTITHAGRFYNGGCDPSNFLRAIRLLLNNGDIQASDILINFLGEWSSLYERMINKMQLSDLVKILGPIPHDECISYLKGSNCNLLIWRNFGPHLKNGWRGVMHGKIGEYIGSGKPILALVPPLHKTYDLMNVEKIGIQANPDSPNEIADAILKTYKKKIIYSPSKKLLVQLESKKRVKRFWEILDDL